MAEHDLRFLLANERTLLAWVRTALTLQAGGIGVLHFATGIPGRVPLGVALLLLGSAGSVLGYVRYRQADRALRRGELPPTGRGPQVVALAVALLAVALVVGQLLGSTTVG